MPGGQRALHRGAHGLGRAWLAQPLEHHGGAQHGAGRVRDPLARDVRADPCTGSNSDGYFRSGFRFADGFSPSPPVMPPDKSLKMSPNRLLATTTSNHSGRRTKFIAAASTCCLSVSISG